MNGRAPKLPLTGSHADPKKNDIQNFWIVSFEPEMSSNRIRRTIPKMLSAHKSIRALKLRSAKEELPRLIRNARTGDGEVSGSGERWPSVRWVTSVWPDTRHLSHRFHHSYRSGPE